MQLPSRRQILAKLEAEKQDLADMKKDPIALNPDAESLARLKAIKGEAERPIKAQVPVRTAQVQHDQQVMTLALPADDLDCLQCFMRTAPLQCHLFSAAAKP